LITLYVLKGEAGKRYVGITNDFSRRLKEHRSHKTKAGQLLDDFIVLYTERFPDYKSARIKEKFLKSGQGRKWLDKLETKSVAVILDLTVQERSAYSI
jgi:putative endonuclease